MQPEQSARRLHPPAMVEEVLAFLRCHSLADKDSNLYKPDAVFLDGTLGTAGHTLAMLKAHPTCRVVAFDRDAESQKIALERLHSEGVAERVTLVNGDFRRAPELLQPYFDNSKVGADGRPIREINGALVDAGMSLLQVSWPERGLSFMKDGPLDMRYNRTAGPSAYDLVNRLSQNELEDLLFRLADERWARRIAAFIADHRRRQPIATTSELARIVEEAIPVSVRRQSKVHPATKTFAALRIAVNDEFWALEDGTVGLSSVLAASARLVILTYSSNEDRTIKRTFRRLAGRADEADGNVGQQKRTRPRRDFDVSNTRNSPGAARLSLAQLFPSEENFNRNPLELPFESEKNVLLGAFPVKDFAKNLQSGTRNDSESPVHAFAQGIGTDWKMDIVTKKPVEPSDEEVNLNPLSRSCKLRAAEKVFLPESSSRNRF